MNTIIASSNSSFAATLEDLIEYSTSGKMNHTLKCKRALLTRGNRGIGATIFEEQ